MARTISGRGALVGVVTYVGAGLLVTVLVWLAMRGPETKATLAEVKAEGQAFGERVSPNACVPEALRRAELCSGQPMCTVNEQTFLNACLQVHPVSAQVCEGVPVRQLYEDSKDWQIVTCEAHGYPDNFPCTQIARVLQRFCDGHR